MAEFVLMHGGMHGNWCWSRLRPELERRGHLVLAPDFPCDDPTAGSADYAQSVANQMDSLTTTLSASGATNAMRISPRLPFHELRH
jgi:pimeloyl-ACP methyl ester carboxylesterase